MQLARLLSKEYAIPKSLHFPSSKYTSHTITGSPLSRCVQHMCNSLHPKQELCIDKGSDKLLLKTYTIQYCKSALNIFSLFYSGWQWIILPLIFGCKLAMQMIEIELTYNNIYNNLFYPFFINRQWEWKDIIYYNRLIFDLQCQLI